MLKFRTVADPFDFFVVAVLHLAYLRQVSAKVVSCCMRTMKRKSKLCLLQNFYGVDGSNRQCLRFLPGDMNGQHPLHNAILSECQPIIEWTQAVLNTRDNSLSWSAVQEEMSQDWTFVYKPWHRFDHQIIQWNTWTKRYAQF